MAPPSSRTVKNEAARARPRHDTRFKAQDVKRKPARAPPPGLREEEDDDKERPQKYKKASPPPKTGKVPARHPQPGRKLLGSTSTTPLPKPDLRHSPERAVDKYDSGWRNSTEGDFEEYETRMRMFYEQLKKDRDYTRKKMIREGLLADPDKPTTLADAITIVGTCEDMCPMHERVERIVQQMVDKCEKVLSPATGEEVPSEDIMVKRFRRSAAGDDEQLPSDIRPPLVLQKTLNYLLEEVVNGPEALSKVHKFVWDRTRAIRNDFSIQQVTEQEDVRIAMDCFERIARFHILALHQLSLPDNVENSDFDSHQELEQLNKTLLSLTYYYDDNRERVKSPNEAEFRAYIIVIEIQSLRPHLEHRANAWPKPVLEDPQVQTALNLYAACGGIGEDEGPWFAGTSFELDRGNPRNFFASIKSPIVPYLLACVAEIFFYHIRGLVLESIWKEFKERAASPSKMADWPEDDVRHILGFDDVDQATQFCLSHGLNMTTREDGETILGLTGGRFKRDRMRNPPQVFSQNIVEDKRGFRTYLEITNGLAPPQEDVEEASNDLEASLHDTYEPLFVSDDSDDAKMDSAPTQGASRATDQVSVTGVKINPTPSSFGKPTPFPLPMSQNRQGLTSFSQSVDSKGPDDINGARSSASNLAPREEQRQVPFDFSSPSKKKPKFSAPVGKWPFPKNIADDASKMLATPPSLHPKNADLSPQVSSENTTAQPAPFTYSNPFKSASPNPFSQVSSVKKPVQPASVFSNSFKPASPNPFSQGSSQATNSKAAEPAFSNPFRSALSSRPDSSKLSSSPLFQATTDNATARSTPSPYSGTTSNSLGAASLPYWYTPDPAAAITSTSTKLSSVFPAASPFSGAFDGNGMQFSNPTGVASLPTWETLASLQRSKLQVSPAKLFPASLAASPFSGSFNGVQFSNPHAAASLPSWTTPLKNQSSPATPSSKPQLTSWSASSAPSVPTSSNSSLSVSNQLGVGSLPSSTVSSLFPKPPGLAFSDAPTSSPAHSPQAAPSLSSSSMSPFNISRPLQSSNSTNASSPLLNPPPFSSPLETAPSVVQNTPSWLLQPETSSSALQNAPPLSSQPEISTSALRNAPLLSSQPEISTSAKEKAASSGNRAETLSSIFQKLPPTTNQTETPFSMLPIKPTTLKRPDVLTPTQMNVPSAPLGQSVQSPKTTVLTMETSHAPALTLTAPMGKEDLKEGSKSFTLVPPTPSGSIGYPSNKIQKDAPTPESSLPNSSSKSSSASPADRTPFPLVPLVQSAEPPEMDPHRGDRRSETIDAISKAIMLDKGCLMQQFLEFHIPHIVQDCIEQVEDERLRKEAKEYRVMMLSKKYLKKWRTNAWKMGLKRRAPERRRKFAQSLQDMARDMGQHKPDFMASIRSQRAENGDRQQGAEFSAESTLTPSSSSTKRKSPDVDYQHTPDRVSRNKRRRPDQDHPEHLSSSRRMKAGHKRSTTVDNPKLSETEELINKLIATRSDYTYLANGSVSSHKIIQKIRTLLPPVKLDDTRSDYFLLKSRGIDPDTPIVPQTVRKRHSSDDIQSTSSKRIKGSSSALVKSESALSPPSYNRPSRSPPSSTRSSSYKYRDRSVATQLIGIDETENDLLAAQRKLNSKMTDVIECYREQRAKWGSGRINTSATSPNRSIEYYKEQRAKWGTPVSSIAINPRQSTSSRTNGVLRASEGRYGVQSTEFEPDTKSAFRAAIEQRQRDLYASMQPGPDNPGSSEGGTSREPSPAAAAAAAAAPAGSSAEDAIEL